MVTVLALSLILLFVHSWERESFCLFISDFSQHGNIGPIELQFYYIWGHYHNDRSSWALLFLWFLPASIKDTSVLNKGQDTNGEEPSTCAPIYTISLLGSHSDWSYCRQGDTPYQPPSRISDARASWHVTVERGKIRQEADNPTRRVRCQVLEGVIVYWRGIGGGDTYVTCIVGGGGVRLNAWLHTYLCALSNEVTHSVVVFILTNTHSVNVFIGLCCLATSES